MKDLCGHGCTVLGKFTKTFMTSKLIFFLLFILCAILIQTTQALPARRVATSGRKLILHTNVYRERYHQKLLEEQRQHNQQQQQIQQQLQLQRQQTSLPHPPSIHHLQQQQQQQQQVQKNHIFSPSQTLRRHPQTQPHHRHHLHQRAAPVTSTHHQLQQYKMSCNGNNVYHNLHNQMNASMEYIKNLCASYLRDRGNETFEGMSETWKLISLETRNPNRKPVSIENELHREIHEFYLNLHNFDQLIDFASEDTNENKTKIEHGEEISIDKIVNFFKLVKTEIRFNMKETNNLLDILAIEKPDLANNKVEFNYNMGRRVRDFLIIKNLIEEFERILQLVQNYCENNDSE
ncbi:integrator complex subunit 4 homolog [Calliphora vicina]|uniref:integrator complex subunit 4 homolog n=1 Tax=Calliphora vicina TaxID=7373 RepID=UPI00325B08A0